MSEKSAAVRSAEAKFVAKSQKIPYYDMVFEKGIGSLLYDTDGKEYIDLLSSAGSANLGHGNKEIADAVYQQMLTLGQYTVAYVYMENSVRLAEKLTQLSPGNFPKKVAFGMTGSDSIDGAIKYAKGYTKRSKLISFEGSYHGSTYGAISVSALSLNMRRKLDPLKDIHHFSYPSCYMCKYGKKECDCNLECLKEIEEAFELYLPPEEVAAVFFEPIAGDAGIICPPAKYVEALVKLCKKHDILFVVDEIQQGMGRSGKWFGIQNFNVEPDMIVCGKSVGGGLPMGCVIGRAEIMDSVDAPAHLFTLGGHASVATAALKMIEIMERDHVVEHAAEVGTYFKKRLEELQAKYDVVGDVRGYGLSLALDMVTDKKTMTPDRKAALKICYNSVQEGVFLIFLGKSSLRIQPPLIITKEQIDIAVEVFDRSIQKYLAGEIPDSVLDEIKGW